MKNISVRRSVGVPAAVFFLTCSFLTAQSLTPNTVAMNYPASGATPSEPARYTSYSEFQQLRLIGIYRPDGSFRPVQSPGQQLSTLPNESSLTPNHESVPPSMLLGLNETVVENFVPPARKSETLKSRSVLAMLRDNIITFAYGHAQMLGTPTHVITDSRGRLIISDPQLSAVHVLDASGKTSFRIAGGPMRRLQVPSGLAVDAEDNIYVADRKMGLISVYDPAGKFLRYLGSVNGESMFDSPSGIAIDGKTGRLYVLDTTADELIVLDLQGKVLNRAGGERSKTAVRLRHPLEITIKNNEVVVLDRFGSRIQILDLDCNPISSFSVRSENGPPILTEVGLAVDDNSHIFISNLLSPSVRAYSRKGEFLGFLGRSSVGQKFFNLPVGLWVDSADRLFVSENNNSRVQVFQIPSDRTIPAAAK